MVDFVKKHLFAFDACDFKFYCCVNVCSARDKSKLKTLDDKLVSFVFRIQSENKMNHFPRTHVYYFVSNILPFCHFVSFQFSYFRFNSTYGCYCITHSTCTTHILLLQNGFDYLANVFVFLRPADIKAQYFLFFFFQSKNHNRAKAYGSNFSISIHTTYGTHLLWNPYAVPNSYNLACNENDENSKCFF